MAKYQIQTDRGTYLIETADGSIAPPAGIPDAGAQMRSSVLGQASALMGDNSAPVPVHPYGGAPVIQTPVGDSFLQTPQRGAIQMVDGAAQTTRGTARDAAGGASKIIRGGMRVLSPTMGAAVVAAPVATVAGLAAGTLAQTGVSSSLQAAGVPQEYSDLAGDVAGIAAGHAGAKYIPRVPQAAGNVAARTVQRAVTPQLDPTEAAAVQYGRDNNVQMPVSVQTGSKVAANAENVAQNLPFGPSRIAKTAKAQGKSDLESLGAHEVGALAPGATGPAPAPLEAGETLAKAALDLEKQHASTANDAYDMLRSIEEQPQYKATLQTGTRRVVDPATVDEFGNPVYKTVPVVQDIQLPVDRRPAKLALKPVLDRILRLTPLAQEQSSVGIKALRNIVQGPDFESASITDEDLGAIKGIVRESGDARSVGLAKLAVDQLSKAVDTAVQRAGPDAVAALARGREATTAKYGAQALQQRLGFKNVGTSAVEPGSAVDMVSKLTAPRDRNIALLREVADKLPDHVPSVAQSVVQSLVEGATADAGTAKPGTALRKYNDYGDETKNLLFGERQGALGNYFTLNKMMAENPNPSGSAQVLAFLKSAGLLLTQPHLGVPAIIGSRAAARMLFDPASSRLMTRALVTPASAPQAAAVARDLTAAMAKHGVTPEAPEPTPAAPAAAAAAAPPAGADATVVKIPGEPHNSYPAVYRVRELDDVQPSHNGLTFSENPKYGLDNQRDYETAVNQGKVVNGSLASHFDPTFHITDNPDPVNGPVVVDENGNALGGNGRAMILQRIYAAGGKPAAAYRDLLTKKAAQFGIDPADVAQMKRPVLVREVPDSAFTGARSKADAIADFNKTGTAALTPAERAIADSRRVSPSTLADMGARLEAQGEDATLADVLNNGKAGSEILDNLVKDGVVTTQERAAFQDSTGKLTKAGRERVSALMLGRFFRDPEQLETVAPGVRQKIERMAAPLAQAETAAPGWDLTPHLRDAVDLLERARAAGRKNLDDFVKQEDLLGADKYPAETLTLARALQGKSAKELTAGARQYVADANEGAKGDGLFGAAPEPAKSLADAFGGKPAAKPQSGAETQAAEALAQAKSGKTAPAESLYPSLFAKLKAGDTTDAGKTSNLLTLAKPLVDSGEISTPDELRAFAQKVYGKSAKAKAAAPPIPPPAARSGSGSPAALGDIGKK